MKVKDSQRPWVGYGPQAKAQTSSTNFSHTNIYCWHASGVSVCSTYGQYTTWWGLRFVICL